MIRRDSVRIWSVIIIVAIAIFWSWPIEGRLKLGLDLKGGAHIVLQAVGTPENPVTDDSIDRLLAVIRNRIDQYGVAEPLIQKSGQNRVIVDLPGIQDAQAALDLIGRTANLEFREVISISEPAPPPPQRHNYASDEQFAEFQKRWEDAASFANRAKEEFEKRLDTIPGGMVSVEDLASTKDSTDGYKRYYLLGPVVVGGKHLVDARPSYNNVGKVTVSIKFNSDGARLFEAATIKNIGRQIAIVLDGVTISAPVVQERISGEGQITGNFTIEEANRLAIMLRAGALPVEVEIAENRSIGPSLGADSIKAGIEAGIIGAIMVFVFMLLFYQFRGLAANVALIVAMLLVFAGMIALNATLTLPGIAGIVLTIGMAVDGNILIYERIKEELKAGKTPVAALDAGFRKALGTILDANLTTLIAAAVLFYFGSGPVRGFGVTLSIGIVASVYCNVVVTRAILQVFMRNKSSAKPAAAKS